MKIQLSLLLLLPLLFYNCVIYTDDLGPEPAPDTYYEEPYDSNAPVNFNEEGMASFIADEMQGKATASGVPFNLRQLVAAHPNLPFGTRVQVTNLNNNKSVNVTIIDVGPFVKGRIIDVSFEAAKQLDFIEDGTTKVRVTVISLGNGTVNPEAL
jgi:rare lipoprotein A (peptidoglycan hydrolase)